MAKTTVTATYVLIGGNDYTAQISKADLEIMGDLQDATTMGSGGFKEQAVGLLSGNIAFDFKKDADLSGLDAAMWTALTGRTALTFEIRKTSASVSTSNPKYTGSFYVSQWNPISGSVGDLLQASHTYQTTGTVSRATS